MNKLFFRILFSLVFISNAYSFNLCGDWTDFMSKKCIKVIQPITLYNETQAEANCTHSGGEVLTIDGRDEQNLLNITLAKYNEHAEYVWLGLKKKNSTSDEYVFLNGSRLGAFKNWEYDPENTSEQCVMMSLGRSNRGKWLDQKCSKKALVVCQKKRKIDDEMVIEFLTKIEQNNDFLLDSLIPMGFIYTQLPKQSSPQVLWPTMNWNDVTKDYSGLFFRAEGKDSNKFGEIQEADQARIANIKAGTQRSSFDSSDLESIDHELKQGEKTDFSITGNVLNQMVFDVTSAENRPRNTAVRIWKRVEWPR